MAILALLIVVSLLVAGTFLVGFGWAVRDGQYDDDHTPAVRMLFDDDPAGPASSSRLPPSPPSPPSSPTSLAEPASAPDHTKLSAHAQ